MTQSGAVKSTQHKIFAERWTFEQEPTGEHIIDICPVGSDEVIAEIRSESERDVQIPLTKLDWAHARLIATSPELADFVRRSHESTNCICKGKMGKLQRDFGTAVPCTKCEAESLLKKAGLLL